MKGVRRYGSFQVDRSGERLEGLDLRQAALHDLPDEKDPVEALCNGIRAAGLAKGRLAVDELGLVPGYWDRLRQNLAEAELVPGAALFRRIRAIKTPEEVDRLRHAARIAERSIEAALKVATCGATERDLARAFHLETVGRDAFPVLECIGFGSRSAMPNVCPSDVELRHSQVIRFDVGGRYRHYRADIARIAVLGEPEPRVRTYYNALSAGVDRMLEIIRPVRALTTSSTQPWKPSARKVFRTTAEAMSATGLASTAMICPISLMATALSRKAWFSA